MIMIDLNVTPDDKLNTYLNYNQDFAVYQPTVAATAMPAANVLIPDKVDVFGSNKRPTIASKPVETKAVDPTTVTAPLSALDKLKEIKANRPELDPNYYPNISNGLAGRAYNGPQDISVLKRQIAAAESDGMGGYQATNPNSSAVGKYQFIWGTGKGKGWADSIKKVTGVKSKEEFMKNPQAQEKFMDFYVQSTLVPQLGEIKHEFPNNGLSDFDVLKLLHFRGPGDKEGKSGLRKILKNNLLTAKLESYNSTAKDYLKATNK